MKTELLMQWLEQPDDLSQLDGCFRSLSNPCVNLIDTLKAEKQTLNYWPFTVFYKTVEILIFPLAEMV